MGQRIRAAVFLESDILGYDEADADSNNLLSQDELTAMTVASLRNIARDQGWQLKATTKAAIIEEMLIHQDLCPAAKSGSDTVLGKTVSALQTGITVADGKIAGVLKNVTGYTGYSQDTSLQSGYYIALDITAPEDASATTIELIGGTSGPVQLDEDMDAVIRITDTAAQAIRIVTTVGGTDYANVYGLTGLTLAAEE